METKTSNSTFNSISHGTLSLLGVISVIKEFLEEDSNAEYTLIIGSDSHEKLDPLSRKKIVNLITAIVVYRKGFGGRYFWQKKKPFAIHSLREKIYEETLASLDCAIQFVPLLQKSLGKKTLKYYLEIHVDVGEHGQTREMIKEVVGMVRGNGFVAKTKPEAYGASYIADRYT